MFILSRTHSILSSAASQANEIPLDLELLEELSRIALPEAFGSHARQASLAFLYLYMVLAKDFESTTRCVFSRYRMHALMYPAYRPSFTLTIRATLPVGAGLGSSAAFSVCSATALMLITGRISPPSLSLPKSLADAVNVYAFLSEKILHGNPSGVDNSVAVYGGGLLYTKSIPSEGKEGGMVPIAGYVISLPCIITTWSAGDGSHQLRPRFTSHRFLLTDTRVPRNTKELVGSVGKQKIAEPARVGKVLDDIHQVVEKASNVLSGNADKESLAVRRPL